MRTYAKNSPEAIARVVAMTLLSDGLLDVVELRRLDRMSDLARLGVDSERLAQVMQEFCRDLLRYAPVDSEGQCQLRHELVTSLLADIDDPALQRRLCRLALDIIGADRRVMRGESVLLWAALDAWDLTLADCMNIPASMPARPLPSRVAVR